MIVRRGMGATLTPTCTGPMSVLGRQCLARDTEQWCNEVSAWNPLSYALCLGQDASKVTGFYHPTPPGAASPGAPCQDPNDPNCMDELTVPGAFTPEQSAAEANANSLSAWQKFFAGIPTDDSPDSTIPWWAWAILIGAGGLVAVNALGGTLHLLGGRR